MEENRKTILNLLKDKSALKQDIAVNTQKVFNLLRSAIDDEVASIRPELTDERVRLSAQEKGDYEVKVMIGSDAIIFQKHSNVFCLEDTHPLREDEYLKSEPSRAYFGVINIYNFLADSFLYSRLNDSGFLIGRIFVNKDLNIFTEGRGQLDFLFKNPKNNHANMETLKHIVQCSFAHALEFDLLNPPFELVEEISLGQIMALSSDLQMKTSKKLGFKQTIVKKEI